MAMVICRECKGVCHYRKAGWWYCRNGHGQCLQTVIPTEDEMEDKHEVRHPVS